MEPGQAEKIVKSFSLIYEKLGLDEIRDEKDLPYRKDEIVEAYRTWMFYAVSSEQNDVLEPLKTGLIFLAHFQPGIGEALKGPLCASQEFHSSVSAKEQEEVDIKELAKKYSEMTKASNPDEEKRHSEVYQVVETEMETLLALGKSIELDAQEKLKINNPSVAQAGQLGKEEKMEHANFVEAYNSGKLKVHVDKNAAGFMYKDPNLLPQDIRKRQATQRFIAFVGLLGGGISFIWLPWWGALLIVLFFLASFKHIQGAASEGVLEAALQDAKVYEMAISEGVLRVEPNE